MHYIVAAYSFFPVPDTSALEERLWKTAAELQVMGLAILAPEGFNGTYALPSSELREIFCQTLREICGDPHLECKKSQSEKAPFKDFQIKIREEIVSLGAPELTPQSKRNYHLNADEWNQVLKTEKDVIVIDTRNDYEFRIGTFKGAVNPKTQKFSEFPEFIDQQKISPNQKMLIFCTGGIRCEKGILDLHRRGFKNVYQLEGGILKYLETHPNDQFEGECLVFDHRVAVDQHLQPTKSYAWCPHCGQPAQIQINCKKCQTAALVCGDCLQQSPYKETCTKNCRNTLQAQAQRQTSVPIR